MKILFFLMLLLSSLLKADDISMYPTILINTKISNINDYPNTKFMRCRYGMKIIGFDTVFFGITSCSEIKSNTIIEGGFEHSSYTFLYAIPKNVYDSTDMITTFINHTFDNTSHTSLTNDAFFQKNITVLRVRETKKEYPIDEETRVYKITSVTDNNVTLKLEKRIIHFTNGEDNKTILY